MKIPRIAAGMLALLLCALCPTALAKGKPRTPAPFPSGTTQAESPDVSVKVTFPITGNAKADEMTRKHVDALIADVKRLCAEEDDSSPTNVEITYEEFRLNPNVVSFLYTQYAYTQGAAYPILSFSADSFNLAEGKRIELTDVVKGDVAAALAPPVKEQLKKVLGEDVYGALDPGEVDEALSDESAYDAFALSRSGLIIQLQEGLLGPHALGAPRLTIPYDQLEAYPWVLKG